VQLALPDARADGHGAAPAAQWHTHTQHSPTIVDFCADNNTPFIYCHSIFAHLINNHVVV
jgi:hypothetical protein